MALNYVPPDDSGPTSFSKGAIVGWHEKRILNLEDAISKISETLLPAVARLEIKVETTNQAISQLRNDMDGFKDELAVVRNEVGHEVTENIFRDRTMQTIENRVKKNTERRQNIMKGCSKMAMAIITTIIATLILVWLKIR